MSKKQPTSIRLTEDARKLISKLSQKLGTSQSTILELAVRNLSKQENISLDNEDAKVQTTESE